VGERLAVIEERSGGLHNGPEGWSGGGSERIPHKRPPVQFNTQGGPEPNVPGQPMTPAPKPQVERRTLPGRTIITGIANADVVAVTLATPRDVRTLRPSGPRHVFMVVYDGQFFRGAIIATVELRDGRTVTEPVPNGPGEIIPPPPLPSLAARLRSDETALTGMRTQVARAEHATPKQRAALLRGPPLSMLVEGLRSIRAIVVADKARSDYLRAHPDILPRE
jgi:hypothetical protein